MKTKIFICTLLISNLGISQTFFTEDFETNNASFSLNTPDLNGVTIGTNKWIRNNNYSGGTDNLVCLGNPFSYSIQNTPPQNNQITNFPNSNYMHIISNEAISDGILCASYLSADGLCYVSESNFLKMASGVSTVGFINISIEFWWLCGGNVNNYGELYYSIDGGITWVLSNSNYYNQTSWSLASVINPIWSNQSDLRFAFRFVNNQGTIATTDPGFSIDDVKIFSRTLNTNDFNNQSKLTIYPNPSNDFIKISGLKKTENYSIYNSLGMEIQKGNISDLEKINIQNLSNGLYFIKFNDKQTIKFVKK
jgi:hypothetical protein